MTPRDESEDTCNAPLGLCIHLAIVVRGDEGVGETFVASLGVENSGTIAKTYAMHPWAREGDVKCSALNKWFGKFLVIWKVGKSDLRVHDS